MFVLYSLFMTIVCGLAAAYGWADRSVALVCFGVNLTILVLSGLFVLSEKVSR